MNDTMSVAEAFVYMVKEYNKMCENKELDAELKMNATVALPYLDDVKELTRKNEVVWKDYSDYDSGIEQFYMDGEDYYAVLLYDTSSCINKGKESFKLYIETTSNKWFVFGDEFENDIINIYNWMTVVYDDDKSTVVDAKYEIVENNEPFEFVINCNYNFEELGV